MNNTSLPPKRRFLKTPIMSLTNNAITTYIADSYPEMKKVVWPTRQETINHTLLVIAISLGIAAFIGVVDYILNLGIEQLIR